VNYYLGKQPILDRVKVVRPEINNKVVFNYAMATVRDITGYFMGTPVQYTPKKTEKMDLVQELNENMGLESRDTADKEIEEFCSICGIGFKYTSYDKLNLMNEVPFNVDSLSPLNTFVVYSAGVGNNPVLAVNYFDYYNENDQLMRRIVAYTSTHAYEFVLPSMSHISLENMVGAPMPHFVGGIPIVEYRNNQWLMGDFEMALTLLDAINTLGSNSMDDIEQIVQSILLLFGIDESQLDDLALLSSGDLLAFTGKEGIKQDGKYISAPLSSSTVKELREYLEESYRFIVGIPDRKTRGGGGGDTGDAVKLRDGWADIELVARTKELFWKQAELQSVRMAITILQSKGLVKGLKVTDVDVKFSRNKNDNIQSKVTAGATLYGMGVAKEDITAAMDITTDQSGFVQRWSVAEEEKQNKAIVQAQKMGEIAMNSKTSEDDSTEDGDKKPTKDDKKKSE
jgi:SPP1 family phage portal protein